MGLQQMIHSTRELSYKPLHFESEQYGGQARDGDFRLYSQHIGIVILIAKDVHDTLLVGFKTRKQIALYALLPCFLQFSFAIPCHSSNKIFGRGD